MSRDHFIARISVLKHILCAIIAVLLIPSFAISERKLPAGCKNPKGVLIAFNAHKLTIDQKRLKKSRKIKGINRKARLAAMAQLVAERGPSVDPNLNLGPTMAKADFPGLSISDMEDAVKSVPSVNAVAPDCEVSLLRNPNDAYYVAPNVGQWALNGTYGIDAPTAWDTSTGSNSVVVGVVDTGVTYDHPDLAANMWHNPDSSSSDVYGHDFVNNDSDPRDDHYHGTHVAGTIGAVSNNGVGIAGVNWNVKIMALKVLNSQGSGSWSQIFAAITWAVDQKVNHNVPVRVLNFSLGGGGLSQSFDAPIVAALNAGIMIIAAAGNSSVNNDISPSYPAGFTNDNIIAVAATDSNGALASFSNYGLTSVDVAAPGVNILSTVPTGYNYLSGTSMATPHVSGLAGLVLSVNPNLTVTQFRHVLLDTGTDLPSLSGKVASGKLINAPRALAASRSGYIIRGRVTTNTGAAQIATITGSGAVGNTTSDAQGYYQYTGLASGASYALTPSATCMTFSPASASGTISTDVTANFTATRQQFTLTGSVVDASNAPLNGVDVAVNIAGSITHLTSASGAFTISIPCQSAYTITATDSTHVFATASGTMSSAASVTLRAYQAGTYAITGRTLASDATALTGVIVTATDSHGTQIAQVQSDSSGNYSISPVFNPETYSLAATKTGFTFPARSVSVTGNTTQNVTANAATFTLRGTVQYQGNGVAGVSIAAGALGSTSTDSNGRFQFSSVPYHTSYSLTPTKASYVFSPTTISGSLSDDTAVNFYGNIPTYTISGRVLDGSGKPLSGVVVNGGSLRSQTTGNNGIYVFSNINYSSTYSISFTRGAYTFSPSTISGTVTADVSRNITGTLNRYNLTGVVRAGGQPLSGVTVNAGALGTQTTDVNGAYSFTSVLGLTPYTIRLTKTGYTFSPSQISGVASNNTSESFTALPNSATISGTILVGSTPLAGAVVDAGARGKRTTNSLGQYSFSVPINSSYRLTVTKSGYSFDRSTVTGTASSNVTLNFAATLRTYTITGRVTSGARPINGASIDAGGLGTATTDSNGIYSFTNVPYGTSYSITVSATGYSFGTSRLRGGVIGTTTANFVGTPIKYTIRGKVLKLDSSGLSSVRVSCGTLKATLTNASGAFTLSNAPFGLTCNLSGTRSGYVITPMSLTVTGNLTDQNIQANH